MSQVAAHPFVLASAHAVQVASGLHRIVPAQPAATLRDRVQYLFDHPGPAPRVVVGALPFRREDAAHLFQPEQWHRPLPASWSPRVAWPKASRPSARNWTVDAVPSRADYRRAVARALDQLARTPREMEKVVLARTLVLHGDGAIDVETLFSRLHADRAVTTFAVPLPPCGSGGRRVLVGATPELLAARRGRLVTSQPLAGSARRQPLASDDRDAAERLARSGKDLREHAAVVAWTADHLAPVCRQLRVPRSPSLVSTASMWHLGSTIEGTLRTPATTSLDIATILHPTPAVCGTPLDRAAATIADAEPFDRGFYGGAIGWNDANGDGEWFVAIRCAEVCGATARVFAGAGIVAGSDPDDEVRETSGKFVALLRAIGVDEDGLAFSGLQQ